MEWTYLTYTIADYGITLGLVLFAIVGVIATFLSSKKGQEFVIERVIGINPIKAHGDYNDNDGKQNDPGSFPLNRKGPDWDSKPQPGQIKQRSLFYIGIFCCLLGGLTLSITAVLMFQGCFLTNVRLLPDDDCPEFPVDCFVFGHSALAPIENNVSFVCKRLKKAEFPNNNISDATAWCYGWIIRLQTTKSVLDQLGVSIALIGFSTTMLAVIIYLGKCKKTVALSVMLISCCSCIIIVLLVFRWSFAPLTYAILSLGIGLGIFGLILFFIIPKPQKQSIDQMMFVVDMNQPTLITNPTFSYSKQPNPTAAVPNPVKVPRGPIKVAPK